jgi:hypothetical protein
VIRKLITMKEKLTMRNKKFTEETIQRQEKVKE